MDVVALVLLIVLLPLFLVIAWRTHKLDRGGSVVEAGWMNRAAHRWHRSNVRQREKWARAKAEKYGAGALKTLPEAKPLHAHFATADSVSERLEEAFKRYRAGQLDLDDYRTEILNEQHDLKDALEMLRSQRSLMERDEYDDERERLDDDKDEIRWRLDWVEKRLRDQELYTAHPEISGSGRWARFKYVDADGVVTDRDVVNWEVSGRYVRAYDRKRKDERNFRIDRISDWVAG